MRDKKGREEPPPEAEKIVDQYQFEMYQKLRYGWRRFPAPEHNQRV